MESSTPEATSTYTPQPTFTSTTVPTQTPTITPTPTQAYISNTNLENLTLIKSLGNKTTFSSFDSISTSRSGDLLAISGPVNNQVESIVYDTSDFSIIATFPNLNNLVFSSDESRIAGNNQGDIEIREFSSERATVVIEGTSNPIIELAWSSGKGEIAGVDTEYTLFIWDSDNGILKYSQQLPGLPGLFSYSE